MHIEVSFFTVSHKTFKMFEIFWFKEVTVFCEILKVIKRFLSLWFFCFWLNFLQNILHSVRSQLKSINLLDSIHDVFTYLATISRRDISKPTIEGAGCKKVDDRENKKIEVFRPNPRSKMRQISINSHGDPQKASNIELPMHRWVLLTQIIRCSLNKDRKYFPLIKSIV